jgi:hypothetical protein
LRAPRVSEVEFAWDGAPTVDFGLLQRNLVVNGVLRVRVFADANKESHRKEENCERKENGN